MECIMYSPITASASASAAAHYGFNDNSRRINAANCCFGDDIVTIETFEEYMDARSDVLRPIRDVPSDAPMAVPVKPAPCVVTRNSATAEFMAPKSHPTKASQDNSSDRKFIDQVFEVNYQVSLTNCNLASKNSDLQMENINLHETIGKMELDNSRQVAKLEDQINRLKKDNYLLSLSLSDLTLSNVEFRKETANFKRENDCLTRKLNQPAPDLSMERLPHFVNSPNTVTLTLSGQNSMEQSSADTHEIEALIDENVRLREKVVKLETAYQNSSQYNLAQRVKFLKRLQTQLHNDKNFIRGAQLLQEEKNLCFSSWNNLQHGYDELQHKFDALASKHDDLVKEMELQKYCDTGSLSARSLTPDDGPNEIFDNFASGTETSETITTSRWRRFYKRGSLSPSSWSLKRSKRHNYVHPVSN